MSEAQSAYSRVSTRTRAMTPRSQRLVDLGLMPAPTADELEVAAIQREQLIASGLLRPDPNEALAESPWDRLAPLQIPGWYPVLRLAQETAP